MRSVIVSAALITRNRFELCHLAFRAIRKLHKPSTRIADTANDALLRLAGAEISNLPATSGVEEKPEPLATEAPAAASRPKPLAAADEPDSDPTAVVFRTDEIDEDERTTRMKRTKSPQKKMTIRKTMKATASSAC